MVNRDVRLAVARGSLINVIIKFVNLCRTGKHITPADINKSYRMYTAELRDVKRSSQGRRDIDVGRNLINDFAHAANQDLFGYCSCLDYASSIGQRNQFLANVASVCQRKCNGGSVLEEDTLEIITFE